MSEEMNWLSPKTDWQVSYNAEGEYTGDYLEPDDYNRIKNNLCYLNGMTEDLWENVDGFQNMGRDVVYGDSMEPFASSFRIMQENLERVNAHSMKLNIGSAEQFLPDTAAYLKDELNRIESAERRLYEMLTGQKRNKPHLNIILGRKGLRI
ncbi:MAG: hypothetical protein NC409_12640 [Clostridium sp.]|nr:hypothetical protein [Clostridium sp.]